jgi:hypothetical protein
MFDSRPAATAGLPGPPQTSRLKTAFGLLALTAIAPAVHGYHLGVEDAAIYLPAIKKHLNPSLYSFNADFFQVQTGPMLFDELVAWSVKLTRLPLDLAMFLWQVLILFAFLWATLRLARRCFADPAARWSAVTMITVLLTMPVSGTKLHIFDQYLHPRSLAALLIVLAAADLLGRRWWRAVVWMAVALFVHPQMAALGTMWLIFLGWKTPKTSSATGLLLAHPFARYFEPTNETWREAMQTRGHYFLTNWTWYMWLGAIAPLAILYGFSRLAARTGNPTAARLALRTALFGLMFFAGALIVCLPTFARFAPMQPMRSLHIVYFVMLLLGGGFLGQYVLRRQVWRWAVLYLPLCLGLFFQSRSLFSGGEHIEWPWTKPRNQWVQAFVWVRENTPQDAVFALAPHAMREPGQDFHGFRGLAERSMLADHSKDAGLGALSTRLSKLWHEQVHTMDGWERFSKADFERLRERYNVSWVIVGRRHPAVLNCPYQNNVVRVCRLN